MQIQQESQAVIQEKAQWEQEKQEMLKMIDMESEIINLNVGGTHHLQTDRTTLCSVPGSLLDKWFKGVVELKKDDKGEVFLDRDGQTFLHVLNYLRNHRELYPDFMDHNDEIQFFKELEHWQIPTIQGFKQPRPKQHCSHLCSEHSPERYTSDMKMTVGNGSYNPNY
jgi:hypothetical protein